MKPAILPLAILLFVSSQLWSQSTTNENQMKWMQGWTNFDPNNKEYAEAEEELLTIIDQDSYLRNDVVYLMSGNVYVTNGATLTIQEGTVIRCDTETSTSLVITKGSRLIARGVKGQPIVFTSNKSPKARKSGDWGGIVIAGSGTINSPSEAGIIEGNFLPQYSLYGGKDDSEMTAIMTYVRIEYAGKKINKSKELNGLSLYALGKKSILNNIMVSYSADDSFEFFGGTVDMNNLISYKAKDDDYDFTLGYTGELYNIVAVRHPYISDISGSYAIEIDGYDKKSGMTSLPLSLVKIKDATLINLSDNSNYQHTGAAISSKNLGRLVFRDSRISGFANVVKFDKSYSSYGEIEKSFSLENSIFNVHDTNVLVPFESKAEAQKLLKYNMFTTQFKSVGDLFEKPLDSKNPKFTLKQSRDSYTVMQ
ncbi:hypothetical protein [Aquimarina sp. 2201CG14-23]|uniref:hypothetical protein n=1 Tax=Aquimarina mycalae TaxID=3040073 RepID=UPI002478127B|nr:hypothetical protein [Aquimarina sp. 2201CG14-23]MDH7445298.1 hypothetical protein [Aquimarina sp. 2201CG14-23]